MGSQQCCQCSISPPATEPKNAAKANFQHASLSQVQNEKMGRKQSCVSPMGTKPNNAAKQSQQVGDGAFPALRHFQVSQKTGGQIRQSRPIGRHMVSRTFDDKNENDAKDLDERSNDGSRPGYDDPRISTPINTTAEVLSGGHNKPVAKSSTSTFETECPSSYDVSRPGHEVPRTKAAVKANDEEQSGTDNKHALDRINGDKTQKSKTKETSILPAVETGDAGRIKRAESNDNHAASSSNDMNRNHEYEQNVKRLEVRVSQLSAEKDGLLNRLSEIGAIQLTENNPNVTDLSDPNRPEKVVVELSEIYDNEWTDAFEHLTKIRKKSPDLCAQKLLEILQEASTICMSSTEKKGKALRKAITKYVGLRKEDLDDIDLKDIEKRIRDYRRKKMRNNFKRLEEEVKKPLKTKLSKETFDDVSEYIGSCVRICWKLYTKEPPMYLDFGDSKEPAQSSQKTTTKMHFDKDKFMSYTMSGNYIDYVVWPAVYLYKDGPIMKKGVAQGTEAG
ncbi:hypothetical protein ACJMK2_031852 [Sinanodonta woodiana]|uniref:Mitochondria-eating protein n=1 Tax=Sinanodonta woodiana TaxID=1069815 RepID=A0ABD3X257_SINWO